MDMEEETLEVDMVVAVEEGFMVKVEVDSMVVASVEVVVGDAVDSVVEGGEYVYIQRNTFLILCILTVVKTKFSIIKSIILYIVSFIPFLKYINSQAKNRIG